MELYLHFNLDMDRSPGFGSNTCNLRAIHTRFPCGSTPKVLNLAAYVNSPDHSTKGTTSHFNVLCVLVNTRFQVLFHSPLGVLFTFPSQYFFTIGHWVVFRLGGWAPRLLCGFHVSADTLDTANFFTISPTGLSPSPVDLPMSFCYGNFLYIAVRNPKSISTPRLASFAFARHYSRNLG